MIYRLWLERCDVLLVSCYFIFVLIVKVMKNYCEMREVPETCRASCIYRLINRRLIRANPEMLEESSSELPVACVYSGLHKRQL